MKNYLNQLAIDQYLEINVNHTVFFARLHEPLSFNINDQVTIDGIEILPRFVELAHNNQLIINESFYCWYHRASNQGWLLTPN